MTKSKGLILASAVASLFASACASSTAASSGGQQAAAASHDAMTQAVACAGINSCKGTSACKGASNACKGQNSCKGQGWVDTASEQECKDKGGTVVAAK